MGTGIEAHAADDPTRVLSRIELPPSMGFIAMSPADEVVTTGPCGTVAWDWRTGAALWAQPFQVRQIAWGAGGALAAAVGPGTLWRVWRTDSGESVCTAPGGRAITRRVFAPDGGTMALTYDDGSLELRDADLGNPRPLALSRALAGGQILSLSRGGSRAVVWAGDDASGRFLTVVDATSGSTSPPLPVVAWSPTAFVSADGRRLAYKDGDIRLIEPESGAVVLDYAGGYLLGFEPGERRLAILTIPAPPAPGPAAVLTYATADGAPGHTFLAPDTTINFEALAPDWSFAVGWQYNSTSYTYRTIRWPLGVGAAGFLTNHPPRGNFTISTDGALIFDRGLYYHEFTGDYMETNVIDAATGAEVQDFVDQDVTPSADGRRLFGQGGAVFCR